MPSFTLYDLNPEFWSKVKAKAAAEGTTVKAVILRLLATWLAAVAILSTIGCGYKNVIAPSSTPVPVAGVPARLELGVVAGTAGTAVISAKVVDAFATALPNLSVSFVASTGTLSAASAQTDEKGIAQTTITAPVGGVTITATSAGLEATTIAAMQPTVTMPPHTPSQPFPPIPPVPTPTPPPPAPPAPPAPAPTYTVSLTASPASITIGSASTLTASVVQNNGAPVPSTYVWDCENDGTAEATTATPSYALCSFATVGTHTAKVTATGGTVTGSAFTTVTVTPLPLTATLTSSAPSVAVGSTLTFTVAMTNLNVGETVTSYQWDLDGTTGFESTTTVPTRTSAAYTTAGLFTAKVLATTSTGRTVTGTVGFVVTN
jgi:hypothetical protein